MNRLIHPAYCDPQKTVVGRISGPNHDKINAILVEFNNTSVDLIL